MSWSTSFRTRTGPARPRRRAARAPGTTVLVGDEHQSIYRFRQRRPRGLPASGDARRRPTRRRGYCPSRQLPLQSGRARRRGFRRRDALRRRVLTLEAGLTRGRALPGDGPAAELLLTSTHDAEGRGNAWRAEEIELSPPPAESNPAVVAEARFLAQRLRALADDGVRAARWSSCCGPSPTWTRSRRRWTRAGLSPYVVGGRGYWSQQQVEDALRILGAIANPLDDELLFGALASPACGASPDSLWLLRQAARDPDGRPGHVWPPSPRKDGPRKCRRPTPGDCASSARRSNSFVPRLRFTRSTPCRPSDLGLRLRPVHPRAAERGASHGEPSQADAAGG